MFYKWQMPREKGFPQIRIEVPKTLVLASAVSDEQILLELCRCELLPRTKRTPLMDLCVPVVGKYWLNTTTV